MPNYLLDTNVLVRFLIGDVPDQRIQAKRWLEEAKSGKRKIFITNLVVAEAVFVLRRSYKMAFPWISEALKALVNEHWLQVENRELLNTALGFLADGKHFVDSYLLAMNRTLGYGILTFDKKFKKQAKDGS